MPASSSTNANTARYCCGRRPVIAVCSARMGPSSARPSKCSGVVAGPERTHKTQASGASPPSRRCAHRPMAGSTSSVRIVDDRAPPMATVASGRCTSAPVPVAMAIGTRSQAKPPMRSNSTPCDPIAPLLLGLALGFVSPDNGLFFFILVFGKKR